MYLYFFKDKFCKDAYLPIEERAVNFGDGVYEVVLSYYNKPFKLDEHLNRLFYSASNIFLKIPYSKEEIENIVYEGIRILNIDYVKIYVQVSRGSYERMHEFPPNEVESNFFIIFRLFKPIEESIRFNGVKLFTYPDIRWERCDIKSLNLLPNVLAKEYSKRKGGFEALFIKNSKITECASSSFFAFIDDKLITHPLTNEILAGITRNEVLNIAKSLNFEVIERPIYVYELERIEECFITGTTTEILPVKSIDNFNYKVGERTLKIYRVFKERIL
ncbi:MAG: aminotransferase class IV [candidate division WOR-3 bacterium]|nr:aminotransferase class IV [candidate division WOR-3 bacterium]MCX7947470.1 aminotransferase class IV [candidate division WOR-3 bacterium]MDW8150629.1 aminotransferase class IV [candidate division WOR-3 bacterium]